MCMFPWLLYYRSADLQSLGIFLKRVGRSGYPFLRRVFHHREPEVFQMCERAGAQGKQMSANSIMENIWEVSSMRTVGSTGGLDWAAWSDTGTWRQNVASKLETFHRSLTLLEDVLLLAKVNLGCDAAVLILRPEVMLNKIKGLLVDLLVFVTLQEFNFIQT